MKIPEGTADGATLRLSGLGEEGEEGAPSGSLYLEVHVLEHPAYRREGDDLHVEVPITVPEAVLGGKVAFAGPTGEVSIKVPPGTKSGHKFRLRGLGAKGKDGEKGNLYARVLVTLPEQGGAKLDEAARAFAPARSATAGSGSGRTAPRWRSWRSGPSTGRSTPTPSRRASSG